MAEIGKPFLRWAGGKSKLVSQLLEFTPHHYKMYIEPFFGGGALFFALQPSLGILADLNPELINFYIQIRKNRDEIIRRVSKLSNNKVTYLQIRSSNPRNKISRAIRFFYLNRTSFNGLYRTNLEGSFNVPYGDSSRSILSNLDDLIESTKRLRNALILCQDFESTCKLAQKGDFVFLDPPYTVAHKNNGFIKYNAVLFKWDDQIRLRNEIIEMSKRGVYVLLTNADHRSVREIYRKFEIHKVERKSLISANSLFRKPVGELIIKNY